MRPRTVFVMKAFHEDGCQHCFHQICGQTLLPSVIAIGYRYFIVYIALKYSLKLNVNAKMTSGYCFDVNIYIFAVNIEFSSNLTEFDS